jgi:hypothetical protein
MILNQTHSSKYSTENQNNVKGDIMSSFDKKTIRTLNIKNQTSAKTKQPFINQYSCNGVVMNSFLQFCL